MSRRERKKVNLEKSRLVAYSATAAAAAVAGPAVAQANVFRVDVNALIKDTTLNGSGVGIDLPFGDLGTHHLTLAHGIGTTNAATGYAFFGPFLASPGVSVAGFVAGPYNYANNVTAGQYISTMPQFLSPTAQGTMAFNAGFTNSQFLYYGIGFMAVRFNTNQYGWIRVNMSGAPLNSFTIVDYAWADPGESIKVGQVPEPGSLSLLALGAAGLIKWRRRRAAA